MELTGIGTVKDEPALVEDIPAINATRVSGLCASAFGECEDRVSSLPSITTDSGTTGINCGEVTRTLLLRHPHN